jgi:uncharacterized membrane protein YtjA (UPF0391 family)
MAIAELDGNKASRSPQITELEPHMLGWALAFLIVAIAAALLGFTGIAVISVQIAKVLFIIFLILFVISLIFGLMRRRPPRL